MRWLVLVAVVSCQGEQVNAAATDTGTSATDTSTTSGECGSFRARTTKLINVGGYCIDESEVTNAQWNEYRMASDRDDFTPSHCSWNTTPPPDAPSDKAQYPRARVNFCDAKSYCAWARKRLCGKIGGGSNAMSDFADVTKSQWYRACSGSAPFKYPYGATYDENKCATKNMLPTQPKAFSDCHGTAPPYTLVFDLSGNIEEWEDSCDNPSPDAMTQCRGRGGAVGDNLDASCDIAHQTAASGRYDGLGFRCCKDL